MFVFFITSANLLAQSSDSILSKAKELRNKGEITEAENLLKRYHKSNPNDFNTIWLLAQTSYWNNNITAAKNYYEEAIKLQPNNYYLKLDYAKVLVETGEFTKASPLINTYLNYDANSADALIAKAKIYYWNGDYSNALKLLSSVKTRHPDNKEAADLYNEISISKSFWVKLNTSYFNDSQPIENTTPSVEAGMYVSPVSSLKFSLLPLLYKNNGGNINVSRIQVENKSRFPSAEIDLTLGAGLIKYPDKKSEFTGKIQFDKLIEKSFVLSFLGERKPYLSTASSLNTPVIENYGSLSLSFISNRGFTSRAAYEINSFNDGNNTYSISAWGLSPSIKFSDFDFKIGYGFSFSSSKENMFTNEKSLETIISEFDSTYKISGIYSPYFTPRNQQIHSLITSLAFHPSDAFQAGLSVNYGFLARTQNPYLYLDSTPANEKYIAKGYLSETYSPMDVNFYTQIGFSKKVMMTLDYNYSSTNFYIRRYAGLGLKIYFGS